MDRNQWARPLPSPGPTSTRISRSKRRPRPSATNWEILRSNIINYSRDFSYIWDEVTFAVANESDLGYTVDVAHAIADKTVGHMMREPIANYRHLLERQRLAYDVHDQPQVYLASPGQGQDAPQ